MYSLGMRIGVGQRVLVEVPVADVVDVHELEPVEGPSGISVGEHQPHVREAVEDPGRHEGQGGVGHGRLQTGRDAARRQGRLGPPTA